MGAPRSATSPGHSGQSQCETAKRGAIHCLSELVSRGNSDTEPPSPPSARGERASFSSYTAQEKPDDLNQ